MLCVRPCVPPSVRLCVHPELPVFTIPAIQAVVIFLPDKYHTQGIIRTYKTIHSYTRFAWAGGTFLQLCCCVSFLFWRKTGFGFTYYFCTQGIVPYCCGGVLVFLVLAGNSFWCYVRTQSQCTIHLCGCVSFFVVEGKLIANTGNPTLIF